jgi:hypothetical protein
MVPLSYIQEQDEVDSAATVPVQKTIMLLKKIKEFFS